MLTIYKWTVVIICGGVIGCMPLSPIENFKKQCKQSGGVFLDCATAFAEGCSQAENIDGKNVICSCLQGKTWNSPNGCQ